MQRLYILFILSLRTTLISARERLTELMLQISRTEQTAQLEIQPFDEAWLESMQECSFSAWCRAHDTRDHCNCNGTGKAVGHYAGLAESARFQVVEGCGAVDQLNASARCFLKSIDDGDNSRRLECLFLMCPLYSAGDYPLRGRGT